ncbi:hypothetical protein RB195_002760 [Necator americanus]|uniref:Uncharacterized protein n=1 Tax=Necator americanus TaxID=51031 RepID=A0ABR1DKI5_NECAM
MRESVCFVPVVMRVGTTIPVPLRIPLRIKAMDADKMHLLEELENSVESKRHEARCSCISGCARRGAVGHSVAGCISPTPRSSCKWPSNRMTPPPPPSGHLSTTPTSPLHHQYRGRKNSRDSSTGIRRD